MDSSGGESVKRGGESENTTISGLGEGGEAIGATAKKKVFSWILTSEVTITRRFFGI
jgi:hypothetical protein